jgi:hypothetical protein
MSFHHDGHYDDLGSIKVDVAPRIVGPGSTLKGHVRYTSPPFLPRLVRTISVTLLGEIIDWRRTMDAPALSAIRHRNEIATLVVCAEVPVPARKAWTVGFTLEVPNEPLAPTRPGQLDHWLEARAEIEDGVPIVHRVTVSMRTLF